MTLPVESSARSWENPIIFCCWVECSLYFCEVYSVYNVQIHTDLCGCSNHYWNWLKSPTVPIRLFLPSFLWMFPSHILGPLMFGEYMFLMIMASMRIDSCQYFMFFCVSRKSFDLKSLLSDIGVVILLSLGYCWHGISSLFSILSLSAYLCPRI